MRVSKRLGSPVLVLIFLISAVVLSVDAQSLDPNSPSPVRTNEIVGRIPARDLGDSRLTDHYFTLKAAPGDLLITVQSNNLNGDIDVFTAGALRPLSKFSLYVGTSAPVTKSIFLRNGEQLVLRVEARTPNDDDGTYQVRFGGSFQPMAGGPFESDAEKVDTEPRATSSRSKTGRRVSSVGARINEPEPPVEVATATPEPSPAATPEATPSETVSAAREKSTSTTASPSSRTPRGRRTTTRRTTARSKPPADTTTKSTETPASTATEQPAANTTETTAATRTPSPARRAKRGAASRTTAQPPAEPEPDVGPRLVIETREGTYVDRSMSSVRRVTVENGMVVIVGKDGKVQRVSLSEVVRMSIAP